MKYTVHLYREMRLRYDSVEAETPEAAAKLASEKQLPEADDFGECDGQNLAALVDVEGDEDFARSSVVDLELEVQRKRMRAALETIARLQMDGEDGFELTDEDAVDSLHSCIRLARDALGSSPNAEISEQAERPDLLPPDPDGMNDERSDEPEWRRNAARYPGL